jgi:phosphinothricin acetyltransferase
MRIKLAAGKIRVRPLEREDWERVLAIYLEGIATGQATFETTAPSWEKWDADHEFCATGSYFRR